MTQKDDLKIIVAIYVRGEGLDPDLVSRCVHVEPSKAQYKGQVFVTPGGREFVAKTGLWGLIADSDSTSLDDHLTRLTELVHEYPAFLAIPGVEEAYVDVFVAAVSDVDGDSRFELNLSSKNLAWLAMLKLPLRVTLNTGRE